MNSISEILVKSEFEMNKLGYLLSGLISTEDIITFSGDLGVGKTFLCRSIINNITKIKEVSSPTFNIVQTYPFNYESEIWHCDFYRISSFEEVEEIGIFEDLKKKLFFSNGQSFIKKLFT